MKKHGLRENASGCYDPTAAVAIVDVDNEARKQAAEERRFNKTLRTIFSLCELAGYRVEGRITLVDQKTGRVWR